MVVAAAKQPWKACRNVMLRLAQHDVSFYGFNSPPACSFELRHYGIEVAGLRVGTMTATRHSALGYCSPNHFETRLQTTSQLCLA
ncbi:hypothetical protein [Hymenobacter agri]